MGGNVSNHHPKQHYQFPQVSNNSIRPNNLDQQVKVDSPIPGFPKEYNNQSSQQFPRKRDNLKPTPYTI